MYQNLKAFGKQSEYRNILDFYSIPLILLQLLIQT